MASTRKTYDLNHVRSFWNTKGVHPTNLKTDSRPPTNGRLLTIWQTRAAANVLEAIEKGWFSPSHGYQ